MNLSSDPAQTTSTPPAYVAMEYRDAGVPMSFEGERVGQSSEGNSMPVSAPAPDPAQLLAARIEEERQPLQPECGRNPSARSSVPAQQLPLPSTNLPNSAMSTSARLRPKLSNSRWPLPAASPSRIARSTPAFSPDWSATNLSSWKPPPACAFSYLQRRSAAGAKCWSHAAAGRTHRRQDLGGERSPHRNRSRLHHREL